MAMFQPTGEYIDYSGQKAALSKNSRTYGALGTQSIGGTDFSNLLSDIQAVGGGRADPRVSKAEAERLLAQNLGTFGITDLDDIGYVIGPNRQPIFLQPQDGREYSTGDCGLQRSREGRTETVSHDWRRWQGKACKCLHALLTQWRMEGGSSSAPYSCWCSLCSLRTW